MSREVTEKAVVSLLLVAFYLFLPTFGYGGGPQQCCGIEGHFLYSFCHGNVWHLVGNIACIWAIRGRFWWGFDYLIAVAVSFLPSLCAMSVCGASCAVFAEVGRRFGGVSVRVAALEAPGKGRKPGGETPGTTARTGGPCGEAWGTTGGTMKTAVKAMGRMAKCVWPAFVIGAVVPGIAVMPHLWALMGGFFVVFGWKSVMRMAKNGGKTGKILGKTTKCSEKRERKDKW